MEAVIRKARVEDCPLIVDYIRRLADFEKLLDKVVIRPEDLVRDLFQKKMAEAVIVEADGEAAGFALYFFNYSTFRGRPGLYLEDFFIDEKFRRLGFGRQVFAYLERRAREEGCSKLQWSVLDWNTEAQSFYRSIGALPQDGWTVFALDIQGR